MRPSPRKPARLVRLFAPVAFAAFAAIAGPAAAESPWKVPTPQTADVASLKDAPAADPKTYADPAFEARRKVLLEGLKLNDLGQWRRGYFAGGDPGKYLPGPAMARLLLDPADEEARKYMNDDRSFKEHYHFAAVNWGRFLPLFGDALTPDTKKKLAEQAARYSAYLNGSGTENHRTMWWTSANVLPHFVDSPRFASATKAAAITQSKESLRKFVKGLYTAGNGEWDSSTYIMFTMNGMMNIYDFSPDPECRLLARAALDWYAASYAMKYTDGIFCAPNQRGYAATPVSQIADHTGWLWWGSSAPIAPEQSRRFLYAVHAATSGWRPNAVLSNIATRNVPLPAEQRNTRPNYWHGHGSAPTPGAYNETVYLDKQFTLASLDNGSGGQLSRWQLAVRTPTGPVGITGGHPTGYKYTDGIGKYDQAVQSGPVYISISDIPADEPLKYAFLTLPPGLTPQKQGAWTTLKIGQTLVAIHPLGGDLVVGEEDLTQKQIDENAKEQAAGKPPKHKPDPILKIAGTRVGFVVVALPADAAGQLAAIKVDAARLADGTVTVTRPAHAISMTLQPGKDRAAATINGKELQRTATPIFNGPLVRQENLVLRVTDGKAGYEIDFTGNLPVYRAWKPD